MSETPKRRRGDRRDAVLLRETDALHFIMGIIYPHRADNEAYIAERIDLEPIKAYLAKKNVEGIEFKYTFFHVIVAALVKTITLRPKLNRFYANENYYQRNKVTAGFIIKKEFSDGSEEAVALLDAAPTDTVDTVHEEIRRRVYATRHEQKLNTTDNSMDILNKLPRFLSKAAIRFIRWLDRHGWCPDVLIGDDPNYASVFLSNLGSIRLRSGYHHLTNWGTCSFFCVIGEKKWTPLYDQKGLVAMRETVDLGFTVDERIADGYYYSTSCHLNRRSIMTEITAKTPWAGHTGDVPLHLDYFDGSMFEALELVATKYPRNIAFDFMGKATTYPQMIEEIKKCARSLKTIGVRAGDKVTIAMPNCPQAIYMFYAVNLVGGIANMIHPLSAEKEIEFYLNESESVTAITLDQFYNKFESIRQNTKVVNIIIASVKDELSKPVRAGYMLTEGRKIAKIPKDAPVIRWKEFMNMGKACFWNYSVKRTGDDPAVILYSGGTTGTTKGIVLTNRNFNALGQQVIAANPMFNPGDKMLAAMPLFHGFGLGVCIHTMLSQGGRCILVPRFTAKSYAKLITKYHCNFIAGVPTLYEALLRLPSMENADLSSLKGVFSGGDSLSIELKKKLDKFLYAHGAPVQVREGYGTTETVTACCLTPPHMFKEGSIGVPFPDTYIKIVEPGTDQEVPYRTEGEILLAGPTVMKEYMKHPDETAQTLRRHADGLTWVYTGDLGTMDSEGFVYFLGRVKRMIVSSGYNVYPGQIENILDANEMVQMSCVIGIPDAYRMQKVKAFVKLAAGIPANDATRQALMSYCSKHIAKYAMPCDIEFRDELPKTLVGKVAYRVLEEEEQAKHAAEAPAAPAEEGKK